MVYTFSYNPTTVVLKMFQRSSGIAREIKFRRTSTLLLNLISNMSMKISHLRAKDGVETRTVR